MADTVSVTQVDREAAAALVRWQREATERWQSEVHASLSAQQFFVADFSRAIMQGIWDEHPVVQAFARHRLASTQPAPAFPREEVAKAVADEIARQDGVDGSWLQNGSLKVAFLDQGEVDFGLVADAIAALLERSGG